MVGNVENCLNQNYQNNEKRPYTKPLPNVCYTYFTEFKNFQNVLIYLIAVGVSSGVI